MSSGALYRCDILGVKCVVSLFSLYCGSEFRTAFIKLGKPV